MPSARRVRLLLYVVLAGVVTILFFTAQLRQTRQPDTRTLQDFYHKTVSALDRSRSIGGQTVLDAKTGKTAGHTPVDKDADGDVDADDEIMAKEMAERLRAAEQRAKDLANAKAPNKPDAPSEVIGVGSSAGGQKKKGGAAGADAQDIPETEEEHEVEVTLDGILQRAPVIIFSKSYCAFSKRAKGVLLEKYVISPAPVVIELDQHPLGAKIQARLADLTGQKTVPNIMVRGKSIGGSDDIAALDAQKGALIEKITNLGGKNVKMTERFVDSGKAA